MASTCSELIYPARYAISSGQATFSPCLFSMVWINELARFAVAIQLYYTVAFRVTDRVSENRGAAFPLAGALENQAEVLAVKDVIAQHQRAAIISDKIAANEKSLGQSSRRRLHGIADVHAPLFSRAKKLLKARRVLRGGDYQYFSYARLHEHAQRVIDHGFVVNGKELLGNRVRDGIQTGACPACQHNAFSSETHSYGALW